MAMLHSFTRAFQAERAIASPRRQRTPLLVRAGRLAARLLPRAKAVRTLTLHLAGFGLLTAAAWTVALPLGLLAAGLSLLFLDFLAGDP